jgi:hypothetical protein
MDTAGTHIMGMAGTHTAPMDTADTVTMVGPTDTAMAADQGMSGIRGVGDKPGHGSLKIARLLVRVDRVVSNVRDELT